MVRLLIVNRGEIARRIDVAAQKLGLDIHFIYESDDTSHLRAGIQCHLVDDYLDQNAILEIAKKNKITLIHPGYGYLSENGTFAKRVVAAGFLWVGPPGEVIKTFSDKFATKSLAQALTIPTLKTSNNIKDLKDWAGPIMVKASMGGGGRALHVAENLNTCHEVIKRVRREAHSIFKDDQLFFEPYLTSVRHIEVQVLADQSGEVRIIGDRDCSIQRRYQKIIEEAPARRLPQHIRQAMYDDSCKLAKHTQLTSCATVEFLFDEKTEQYWLMEVNPRIQVEHGVTELVSDIDLVGWQLKIAMGKAINFEQSDVQVKGHAIQARIYAEDPEQQFQPTMGALWVSNIHPYKNVHWHTSIQVGQCVSQRYDAMIMKVMAYGETFNAAKKSLVTSLKNWHMAGVVTNREWLVSALEVMQESQCFDTQWASNHFNNITSHVNLNYIAYVAAFLTHNDFKKHHGLDMMPGWTITGRREVKDSYYINDKVVDIVYQWLGSNVILTELGKKITLQQEGAQHVLCYDGAELLKIQFSRHHENIWVLSCDGFIFTVRNGAVLVSDSQAKKEEQSLVSPMPGTMVSCHVKAGDIVNKGDVLAIIEAMKMHHEITACKDLKIITSHYQQGQHVPMEQPLFEWEAII